MSHETFALLIGLIGFIAMVIYTAAIVLSIRNGFTRSMRMPPCPPPPLDLLHGNWTAIRARLRRDLEFVVEDDQKVRIIMSAIDVAYQNGRHDQKTKENKA